VPPEMAFNAKICCRPVIAFFSKNRTRCKMMAFRSFGTANNTFSDFRIKKAVSVERKVFNKKTEQALKDIKNGKVKRYTNNEDMFRDLGIR